MARFLDKTASLTPLARRVICDAATEYPNTGNYNSPAVYGSYLCRRCGLALFRVKSQFYSGCGWPSFDEAVPDAINYLPDLDGHRVELRCSRCEGHLGHVFEGEYFTPKNRRYCINSVSLDFVEDDEVKDSEEAIVAGGCFWGVEYFLKQMMGVLKVEVGYTGGLTDDPTYQEVCEGYTGHYEAVRVVFDPFKTNYLEIVKRFFEIHDPTQKNGQGPDLGSQYKSAIFYYNSEQRIQAESLIELLKNKGYSVATQLLVVKPFWPAEEYHQNYYSKHQKIPYCHKPVKRFE